MGNERSNEVAYVAAGLTQLAAGGGAATLAGVAEAVRGVAGAERVYVVRRLAAGGASEVVASAGAEAPAPRTQLTVALPAPADALVVPLVIDSMLLGHVVAEPVAAPLSQQAEREVALLAAIATLTLQNQLLAPDADRRIAQQARHHFRLLSGTIYHLKNSLANASEYLELIELQGELSDPQREYIARSRRSTSTAMRLLTELHELGRTDAGEFVPHAEPVHLEILLRDILRDYQLSSGTSGVRFAVDLQPLPVLQTDPDCVRQVLDTLLTNAVRYSPANGVVTVRTSVFRGRRAADPAQLVRLDVVDTGPGVSESDDVFEEVQRVERKGPPGFRLAISRRIARLLGGDLTLETSPGGGSTFSLWLPLR